MTATSKQKYGTILTPIGKAAIANAIATDTPVKIKYFALGDGNGVEYTPEDGQEALKREVYEAQINAISTDEINPNWILVEGYVPETVGGFTIREIAIKDENKRTIAIGSYPSSTKPILSEGAAVGTYLHVIMEVTNSAAVNLVIDPSIVLATRDYVDKAILAHMVMTNVHGGTYEKTPLRLMFRNEDGRVQAAKPKVADDVARLEEINEIYESITKLTDTGVPLEKQYTANGVARRFEMAGLISPHPEAVLVTLNGVEQAWGADYTIDLEGDTPAIVFAEAPADGVAVRLRTMVTLTQATRESYEPLPDTLAKRNNRGATQVADPVEDQDAVPFLYMKDYVDSRLTGGAALAKPIIIAPEAGSVIGAFTFLLTVTPLEVLSGGNEAPTRTQVRILGEDRETILSDSVQQYSVTPTVFLPDDLDTESPFYIVVRHENGNTTWSPWSDASDTAGNYTLSPIVLERVKVIAPATGSDSLPVASMNVTLAAGAWSDGSDFVGSQTRCAMRRESDDTIVWQTGTEGNAWVDYTTSVTVPAAVLQFNTGYWIEAQHRAVQAPETNPYADVTSAAYTKEFSEASRVRTMAATAPDVTNLQHDTPAEVMQGSFTTIHIWGATSTDGGFVTYSIVNVSGGLSFSKLTGIVDNESITMVAPSLEETQSAAFSIVAHSSYGAESITMRVKVDVQAAGIQQDMSVGRYYLAATSNGAYMLFGGGYTGTYSSAVDAYNASLTRSTATALSVARYYVAAASNVTYMLFGGGTHGSGLYSSAVDAYNASLTRTIATALSVARYHFAAASNGAYMLFGGGTYGSSLFSSAVDAYNASLTRSTATALSVARYYVAAASNGTYMLFGGGRSSGTSRTSAVDAYNASLTRTTATALSVARDHLTATSNGTYMLFGGGDSDSTSRTSAVDAYNASLTRTIATALSVARNDLAATSNGAYMLFGGGYTGTYSSAVDAYNASLTRTTATALSVARYNLAAASNGTHMLFGGGRSSDGTSYSSAVDAYDENLNHTSVA